MQISNNLNCVSDGAKRKANYRDILDSPLFCNCWLKINVRYFPRKLAHSETLQDKVVLCRIFVKTSPIALTKAIRD